MKVALIYNTDVVNPNDVINLFGMSTKEHYSLDAIEQVAKALEKGSHNVKVIKGDVHIIDELKEFMPKVLAGENPGMVFNMAYGIQGQNRYTHVPALLEMLGIPYVGSDPEGHAIVQDKVVTKIILQKNNIPTPGFWVFRTSDDKFDDLIFPVIVKPTLESTSMGMEVVDNWNDLRSAVQKQIEKYSQDILVEQFIPGREFAVGLLGNGANLEVLPIVEADLGGDPNKIQTIQDKKKSGGIKESCPADLSKEKTDELKQLSAEAFHKLGLKDYTRVDVRMDKDGNFYILELNSMASLRSGASFAHAAKTIGYNYESLINKILDVACIRYFGESAHNTKIIGDTKSRSTSLKISTRSYLRSHLGTTLQLLKNMINVNTNVKQIDNINKIGSLISKRLRHLGFQEHLIQKFDIGDMYYFTNHDDGITNDVLLLAHLDTPYSARDFIGYREEGNKIFGSGLTECKGGIAVMLSTLQALRFSGKLKNMKIGILLTTDDSLGGMESKTLVEEYSKKSKYVIGLKWGGLDGSIITSCLGRDDYQIELSSIHDSFQPVLSQMIPTVCKKITSINKLSKDDSLISLRSLDAHASFGRSPDHASITLVTNFSSKSQRNELEKNIKNILKNHNTMKLDIEINKGMGRDPLVETKESKKFFDMAREEAESMDLKLKPDNRGVSSGVSSVPVGIPVIDGMGPLGSEYRSPNEFILRDSMIERSVLLSLLLSRCSKQ